MVRVLWIVLAMLSLGSAPAPAEEARGPVAAIERELSALLKAGAEESTDPAVWEKLASLYLDLGDGSGEITARRAAYEAGAQAAKRALAADDRRAEAHYLYAANLGSRAQLDGVMASAMTIRELKAHVGRALELNGRHAPSLHMMGMMYEELPWVLGGDRKAAVRYLEQAVAAAPDYQHARLDLAKVYVKRKQIEAARRELRILLDLPSASGRTRYQAEAAALLASLGGSEATVSPPSR
ncbi:tetratricopeptide repeat protein [Candidatus Nitrospira bockiana]